MTFVEPILSDLVGSRRQTFHTPAFSGPVSSGITAEAVRIESSLKSSVASTIFQGQPLGKNCAVKVPVLVPDTHVYSLSIPLSVGLYPATVQRRIVLSFFKDVESSLFARLSNFRMRVPFVSGSFR